MTPREPRAWRKGWVSTELLGPYPAEISQVFRWKGHACPRFTRQVAEQIAEDATTPIQLGDQTLPPDYTSWYWDGDVLVLENNRDLIDYGPDSEAYLERYEPDQDGKYHVGDWEWEAAYSRTPPVPPSAPHRSRNVSQHVSSRRIASSNDTHRRASSRPPPDSPAL